MGIYPSHEFGLKDSKFFIFDLDIYQKFYRYPLPPMILFLEETLGGMGGHLQEGSFR
jgi:hypothetical protein